MGLVITRVTSALFGRTETDPAGLTSRLFGFGRDSMQKPCPSALPQTSSKRPGFRTDCGPRRSLESGAQARNLTPKCGIGTTPCGLREPERGPRYTHGAGRTSLRIRPFVVLLRPDGGMLDPCRLNLSTERDPPLPARPVVHDARSCLSARSIDRKTMSSNSSDRYRPNLFIIGAAKSGTTSLHHHLSRHPEILMSEPKEPGFFVDELDYYPKDEDWYLSLFAAGADLEYRGESSTHYTKLPTYPGVPGRMASYCERPRLIYLMRDPIDRAISHYWHNTRQNAEFRPPLRAMKENEEFRAFGEYARQLEPYLEVFDRADLYITTFERLISDPETVTSDIYRWLNLDPSDAPDKLPAKNRKPNEIERFLAGQTVGEFLQSDVWDRLSPFVPQRMKDLGKAFTRKPVRPSEQAMDEVIDFLRPWARDSVAKTSRLLGREFTEWTTSLGDRC